MPYLSRQIIPYIGNKRRLLPQIHRAVLHVFPGGIRGKSFLDPFAGSGVVSRFAKYLGFEVFSNDWELYSYLSCFAFLKINLTDLEYMYAEWGGMDGMLEHMNSLPPVASEHEFIARYYSPKNDAQADYRRERLFYTRENGCTIDKIRNEIERLYPFPMTPPPVDGAYPVCTSTNDAETEHGLPDRGAYREKALLLALLIHGAATHTNTSGVFKAYHKGFGGFSGDALGRIMKPIVLRRPPLWDSNQPQHVFMLDAVLLPKHLGKQEFDIAYLDPPYNQHQYGSNYHLLNTIALWDGLSPGDRETGGKAGIRRDWVLTRSDYCYRDRAFEAFNALLGNLKARHIFISYSTEGIVPFDDLMKLCASCGKVKLFTDEYVKYRGGRQSIHRLNHNVEFVILIDTAAHTVKSDLEAIDERVTERKLNLQFRRSYVKARLQQHFTVDEVQERVGFELGDGTLWIETQGFLRLEDTDLNGLIDQSGLTVSRKREAKERLLGALKQCQCIDRVEELQQVLLLVRERRDDRDLFAARIPDILRKFAHKKYREIFMESLAAIRDLQQRNPELFNRVAYRIDDIEELAKKRFEG